jgi:exodeoxyribonuclease-5
MAKQELPKKNNNQEDAIDKFSKRVKAGEDFSYVGQVITPQPGYSTKEQFNLFGESKYDKPLTQQYFENYGDENLPFQYQRAQEQSSLAKIGSGLANAVTQTGLDIIKDASYLLDYRNYTDFTERAKEGFHNDIADAIQSAEDKLKLPVYRTKESEGFSPLSYGWWGENIPSILTTVSMMVPAQGAVMGLSKLGKTLGGAKLIRGIEAISGTKNLSAGLKGITGAVISRQMENIMEGGQTFEDTYRKLEGKINPNTNQLFTEDEKKAIAGEAAANNYKLNWANIATDLPQYMLLNKSFSQMIKDQRIGLSDVLTTMGQEAGEEAYQFITNEETKRAALIKSGVLEDDKSSLIDRTLDYAKDGEFWTSAFLGGLGGGIFAGVGKFSENKNIEKLQKQQEAIIKLHTAVIKGDEQSFNRTTDDVFHKTLMDNITDLDNFKSMLDMTPEAMDDPEERVKSQKTLNDRKQVIKFAEDYRNTLASDNTKDDIAKATELDYAIDQKLTENRLKNINTELTSLKAEDAFSLNLQDPTLYQFKNLKMQYEAIKDIPQFADKAKQLQLTIAENYNLLLSEGVYSSKEDIDKQLISPNDSKLINLIRNQELDTRTFNQNKEALYKLSTPEGRDEIKKGAEEELARIQNEAKLAAEQAAKTEQAKIIDMFANKINSGEQLASEEELAYYNANKKAIDSRVEELKVAGNNIPTDILDILNKDAENEANFEEQKANVTSQPAGDIFGETIEPTETELNVGKKRSKDKFIPVNEFDLKKGDILYNLYTNTQDVANSYTIKAFNVGGKGSNQYLKGILLVDNETKKEKWWNSKDKINWNNLFVKSNIEEKNLETELGVTDIETKNVLKDVKSTTDGLYNAYYKQQKYNEYEKIQKIAGLEDSNIFTDVSEAYHKAKKDGSNPELVKAVEELLSNKQPATTATDIEAKRADIERRRQEELDKAPKSYTDFKIGDTVEADVEEELPSIPGQPILKEIVNLDGFKIRAITPLADKSTAVIRFTDGNELREYYEPELIEGIQRRINAKYDAELAALKSATTTTNTKADIEKANTFTRDSLKEISDGTGLAKKGTEILNPDKVASQLKVGDKITFYAEKERTGIWDGKSIREDKSNNPFGILGILSDVNGYIKNQSKIDAELKSLEGGKPKVATLESELQDLNNKKEKAISDLTNANLPKEVLENSINIINERFNDLENLVKQKYGVKEELNKQIEKIEDAQNTKENIIVNANDGIVPEIGYKERKALENELNEDLEFTNDQGESVSPQGNSVTLGDLIINAAKSIAYLSKSYISKFAKLGEVTYSRKEDISEDQLNELIQEPMLLSGKQYQVGDELNLSVDTTFNLTLKDGTVITYEQTKNNPYLVPIKITNKEGKIIGYLHTLDWITESNVASKGNNIEIQRNALKALREDIVAKGTKKVFISNKTLGKLNFTTKKVDKPTSEVIKNPNVKFVIGKNNSFYEGLDKPLNGNQPINKDVKAGLVYMVVDTPVAGKTIAIPVFNNKISDEIADTLTNAAEAFFKQDAKIGNEILKQTGIDILTANGLRSFFELYVATASFDQADLNNNVKNDTKLFLNVLGSGIQYGTGGGVLKSVGNLANFNKSDFNKQIKRSFVSIFLKHLNKPSFKQVYIDNKGKVTYKESTYTEFIKNNTTTNVSDIKLPDGSYTLFVQPVITFEEAVEVGKNILNDSSKPSYTTPSTKSDPTKLGKIDFDALNDEKDLVDESPVVLSSEAKQPIKEGVAELFESNPELANAVYEALGFKEYSKETKNKLALTEKLKDIFKDKSTVLFRAGDNTDAFYIDLVKTSDNRYFYFSENQSPEEISKQRFAEEIKFIDGQIATTEEKDAFINSYLEIADLDQISENPLLTKEEKLKATKDILKKVTPQQKQQALQAYSQYLDTIFPESKVKDIVYHVGYNIINNFTKRDNGIYFTDNIKYAEELIAEKIKSHALYSGVIMTTEEAKKELKKYSVVLNSKNIKEISKVNSEIVKNLNKDNFDTIKGIEDESQNVESYVVFEPEQIHILGSKQDIQGFKEFTGSVDLSPPTLSPKSKQEIADASSLIPGFNAFRQGQVVNIMNGFVLKSLKEKGAQTKSALYNELKNTFVEYEKAFRDRGKVNYANEFKKILDNYEEFVKQSEQRLTLFNVKEVPGQPGKISNEGKTTEAPVEDVVGVEDVESNNEKVNYDDGATFLIDSKESMSSRLKQFLSFITSPTKSYLQLDTYMPFDEVVNYLSGQLAGMEASYADISARLGEIAKVKPWVKEVKNELDNASDQIKNEFVQWATKHYANFKIAEIFGSIKTGGISIKVMDSDQNAIIKTIQSKWLANLKTTDLVKETTPGNLIIDNSKRKELVDELNSIDKNDLNAVKAWLAKIGIEVSMDTLEAIKNNPTSPYAKQFTDKNGIFFNIVANLSKETLSADDTFDTNNPLTNNSGIKKLAAIEALYSDAHFSNSFKNGEGKSVFAYSNNKYFINQFYRLKRNVGNYLNNLMSTSFASTSSWGKQLKNKDSYFSQVFDYFYLDTLKYKKEGVTLDHMSSREHELTKLALFWNQNNGRQDEKISHFLFPTMSDKSTMTGITALRHNVQVLFNEDGSIELSESTKDALYDVVEAEYKRILQSYNIKNDIDGYNPNMFYFFEELNNNKALWEETTITDENGKEITRKTLKPLNQINQNIIKEFVADHALKLIEAKKQHWTDLGLTTKDSFKFADKTYITAARNNLREANKNMSDVITYAAADYVINYVIANANSFQLFVGDPALFFKKDAEKTWINVGKRLAAEIAPGLELADSKNNKFTVAFAKDASGALSVSMNFPQLLKMLDGLSVEEFNKLSKKEKEALDSYPYYDIEGTDAQELTILAEHLYVLEKSGKISPEKVKELLEREEKGTLNKYDFVDIFQPIKPVYVNTQLEPSMDVNRKIYIKSSSFPLVKGLTPEMDKLRDAMIKNGVDRLAFKTATKVGGPKEFIDIFNQDGTIKSNLVFDNKMLLDRSGFRIQQDVPFDAEKDSVNRGSQEAKLLFANILDMEGFNYNGETINGKQLQDEYNALNKQLFANGKRALLKEITDDSGNLNLVKVQKLLIEEAKGRGWPQNDIDALRLVKVNEIIDQFAMPLWASTSANKIEALLSSLVDNKVRKQKLRGNSFVLGSEEGFRGKSKDIIYTKSYNPETGLLPMRIDKKTGKVLPAQILITNKLKDQEGNPVNLQRFMTRDGYLDLSKIDPKLLTGFGFRIPTQLHSSMSYVEVVGFLPSYMGDLVIAPKDFTKQMGSDFDVDKLYTYMYNAKIENGKLVRDDSSAKKKLQNELLDVHISVMSNPNLFTNIVNPLGFGELPSIANKVDSYRSKRLESKFKATKLNDTYQKEKYLKARAGKSGTGVKSLDSVFTAISQGKDLYLRTVSGGFNPIETKINLVFGDESGKAIELNNISEKDGINNKPKINTVSAYQSAAVDNEKEQILEKINSNNYTFDAERALAAVGFDESFIAPLTSQDAIFDYANEMARSQDSVNDEFISNPEQTIITKLINKYATEGNIDSFLAASLMDPDYPLTKEEMWSSIEMGEKDPNYYKTQIRALVKFNKAREIGKEISNIQLTINTDSAGISPSLIESNYKEEKVNELFDNKYIANVENLLDNTINGFATDDALRLNNSLWYHLFPYGKISQVFNELQSVLGKKVLTNEKRLKIFNGIKSFVYSKQSLGLDNENVRSLREKLFFDRAGNKSLASQVKELQKTSKNPFITRLMVDIDPTGNKPSLIKYNAGAAENFDELNVYQGFIDLIGNEATTELAQNMITYFYISGGIQQAIQFGKYIPNSYLRAIGFDENLRNLNFEDPELLGILDLNQKSNYYEVSNFVKQYIQHNPGEAIKLKDDLSQIDPKSIKRDFNKTITEFTTTNKLASDILVGRVMPETNEFLEVLPEFVNLDFKLYQYTGNGKYVLIDTLGSFGYSEYTQGEFNVDSLVYENKANKPLPKQPVKTDTRDVVEKEMPGVANNLSDTRRVIKYNIVNIDNALDIISKTSTNLLHKALAPEIRKALKNSPKVNIAISNDPNVKGFYAYDRKTKEGTVVINEANTRSDEDFERTLLHELVHHLTGYIAKDYEKYLETGNKGELTDEQIRICNSLKTMQNTLVAKIKSNPKWQAQYDEFVKTYESKKHVDEIQVSKNYGAYKFSEFFTMAMTDMEFQKILNDIPFDSNKTILDRFVELVNKLLASVGFPVKENSVLSNAVSNIVELINLTNPQYAEELSESTIDNNPLSYTNHSGGAYGGDTFWDLIGREFGVTNHMHYKDAGNANLSQKLRNAGVKATILTKEQMDKARLEVERLLGEKYPDTLQGNLQVRNYYQVANADAVFAIAEISPTTRPEVMGGTNTAVKLGIKMGKPVYVFDLDTKKWYTQDTEFLKTGYDSTKHKWDYNGWKEIETPTLTKNFAGVGSRDIESYNVQKEGKWVPREQYKGKEIEEAAKQAIRDVYANTFKATNKPTTQPSAPVTEQKDFTVKDAFNEVIKNAPTKTLVTTHGNYDLHKNAASEKLLSKSIGYSLDEIFKGSERFYILERYVLDAGSAYDYKRGGFKPGKYLVDTKNKTIINLYSISYDYSDNVSVLQRNNDIFKYAHGEANTKIVSYTTQDFKDVKITPKVEQKTADYKYFGAPYKVILSEDGSTGIDVVDYKGKPERKALLLSAFNTNRDVDPQQINKFAEAKDPTKNISTPFSEVVESNQYKLPDGRVITFNDQQVSAINNINEWLKGDDLFYTLSGFAGTGKTTLVKSILDKYKGRVAVSAPTHKAKKVIQKSTKKTGYTIQKLLGLMPNTDLDNFDINRPQFDPKGEKEINRYGLIIIDEASMLNKDLFNLLLKEAEKAGTKILFMGDAAQLPPVGEQISQVFSLPNKSELTKVERQKGDNPLMLIYDSIRNNLTSLIDRFIHTTSINNKNEGIVFTEKYKEFEKKAIELYNSEEYKKDKDFVKILTWTNDDVKYWNGIIRNSLFDNPTEPVLQGDLLMAYNTIQLGPYEAIENSADYVVVQTSNKTTSDGLDVISAELDLIDEPGNPLSVNILLPNTNNYVKFVQIFNQKLNAAKQNRKLWPSYFAFKNKYLLLENLYGPGGQLIVKKDLDYGYAITVHKSQGSTYTNVLVNENNIDKNSNASERNKLKYVAFSRPTQNAYVLSDKTDNNRPAKGLTTEDDIFGTVTNEPTDTDLMPVTRKKSKIKNLYELKPC